MQRFYGGDPVGWLTTVPFGVVIAYHKALPMLVAEESQLMAERVMVGTGSADQDDLRSVTKRWALEAARQRVAVKPAKLPVSEMGQMGIGYRVVTRG